MKIKEIHFHNFRAYKQETFTIPDDKNIILIYARNGFGKTSFFDGVEWGLTGELRRYSESVRERNEYPLLRHSFSDININDGVKIQFDTDENIKRFIKEDKKEDYAEGQLIYNGKNIKTLDKILVNEEFMNDIDFSKSFAFTQLLSQELLNDFVRHTKDNDRYKTVVDLFGLSAYRDYDEHIRETQLYLKNEIENIAIEKDRVKNNIELKRSKLISLDVQPSIKLAELERIYGSKIDLKNIKLIKEEFTQTIEKLLKENTDYKNTINQLIYLKNNFQEKEKQLAQYINLTKEIAEYQKFIEQISKRVYFESINKNLDNAKLYNEKKDNIEKINKKLDELNRVSNSHDFFDKSKDGDDLIYLLADYKKEYKDNVSQYFESKKIQKEQYNILNHLEADLKRLSSLKNELYYLAKSFLEDTQNKDLKECPVCENDFDRNSTINKLNEKLSSNINSEFQLMNDSIQKTKTFLLKNESYIEKEEKNLLNICTNIKAEYREKFKTLLSEKKQNDKLLESYNVVMSNMKNLTVDSKNYKEYREQYFKELKKSKFYVEDMHENFYREEIFRKENEQKNIYRELEDYKRIKALYNINSLENVENLLNEKEILKKQILYKIENINRAITLSSELILFEQSSKEQKEIKELEKKLVSFEKDIKALNKIKKDYDNFKKAIKVTIDNETKRLLSDYGEIIEKFYHYLNPSIYMNNLSIKETRNNANRLVFEVSSENGKKHSPSYIFSSAQNNVLALSIFLSFAIKQKWSKLDTIFLDDPIQNMDDINIHSFVDLIRSIQKQSEKQFFISTHDERIYNFMLNKFGKDNVHSFVLEDYGKLKE